MKLTAEQLKQLTREIDDIFLSCNFPYDRLNLRELLQTNDDIIEILDRYNIEEPRIPKLMLFRKEFAKRTK